MSRTDHGHVIVSTEMIPPPFDAPPPPPTAVPRHDYRVQMAEAMHKVDCGCADYIQGDPEWGDEYYDRLATAAWAVVSPEIARLRRGGAA
jgi:hypothetical protein